VTAQSLPIVGVAELGYMLNVKRARVTQLVAKSDFPTAMELRMGKVWWAADVEAWAAAHGRTLRPLPASWPVAPEGGVDGAPLTAGRYRR